MSGRVRVLWFFFRAVEVVALMFVGVFFFFVFCVGIGTWGRRRSRCFVELIFWGSV